MPDSPKLHKLTRSQIDNISLTKILYVKERAYNSEYSDYLETYMLVSEKLKRIMSKYQSNAIFKTVVLIERKINRQEIYYLISAPLIQCASDQTVYNKQGQVKEFVLDEEKVGHARIFKADNYENHVLVRLDVAESILRRDSYGVSFDRVTIDRSAKPILPVP